MAAVSSSPSPHLTAFLSSHSDLASLFSSSPSAASSVSSVSPLIESQVREHFVPLGDFLSLIQFYRALLRLDLDNVSYWHSHSIFLHRGGHHKEAFQSCQQTLRREPKHFATLLLAGQLCLNHLGKCKEALVFSTQALALVSENAELTETLASALHGIGKKKRNKDREENKESSTISDSVMLQSSSAGSQFVHSASPSSSVCSPSFTVSHLITRHSDGYFAAHLLFALSCSAYSYEVSTFSNRKQLLKRSLAALQTLAEEYLTESEKDKAMQGDLHLALATVYADIRDLSSALQHAKSAIRADKHRLPAWHLLALILSAQQLFTDARKATDSAIAIAKSSSSTSNTEFLASLLILRIHLSVREFVSENEGKQKRNYTKLGEALKFAGELTVNQRLFAQGCFNTVECQFPADEAKYSRPSLADGASSTHAETDSPFVERLRSDALVTISQLFVQCGAVAGELQETWFTQAQRIIDFAFSAVPTRCAADLFAQAAAISHHRGSIEAAIASYQLALSHDSSHVPSLVSLASIHNSNPDVLGHSSSSENSLLAEGFCKNSLQVDGSNHRAWYEMGISLERQGKKELAVQHFLTAVELEKSSPILPFYKVRREFF